MTIKYQIHKNFLAPDLFKKINDLIMNRDFPWRKRDHMTQNDPSNKIYFSYCFYNDLAPKSRFYEPYIIPVLKQLQAEAPIQVRVNMTISALFEASNWHCDYPNDLKITWKTFKCKSAILYLNDCDGGTELKINNKIIFIKADANKMLVFDNDILHRAITSKDAPIRYIINFNYFTS